MHTPRVVLVVGLLAGLTCVTGPRASAAPATVSARPKVVNRASMETMQIPSHGELMNAQNKGSGSFFTWREAKRGQVHLRGPSAAPSSLTQAGA